MNSEIVPIDIRCMERVGGQLGTNPAGIYSDSNGQKYYVKILASPMHARNEFLAAKLYLLAGAPVLNYLPSMDPCQIVTRWVELDKKKISHFSESERRQAQRWFAVHAWTANWDAAGFDGDNQGVADGKVLTLDVGGALAFRAHGAPKGKAFGTSVEELNVLRNDQDNPHAMKLFSDITPEQLHCSIQSVTKISDKKIGDVILENGGGKKLVDKMIARKKDMCFRLKTL
jgi:DNA-binding beta-propeller fold protein YncE